MYCNVLERLAVLNDLLLLMYHMTKIRVKLATFHWFKFLKMISMKRMVVIHTFVPSLRKIFHKFQSLFVCKVSLLERLYFLLWKLNIRYCMMDEVLQKTKLLFCQNELFPVIQYENVLPLILYLKLSIKYLLIFCRSVQFHLLGRLVKRIRLNLTCQNINLASLQR